MNELTIIEKQILTREIRADKYADGGYEYADGDYERRAFVAGWDAAMEYVNDKVKLEQQAESGRSGSEPAA